MYRLETDNFLLELNPKVHQNDLSYPANTSLGITVSSYCFSAESVMDISVLQLVGFAVQLNNLYDALIGSARLEELYAKYCYIEFSSDTGRHIKVSGCIHNKSDYGYTQKLNFENEIEQTYLREFAKPLFADYGKYTG